MDCDDYVNHIRQKFLLAVAISVLKTKPEEVSVEQHIENLRSKINNMETELDISVCSDDFNLGDDSDVTHVDDDTDFNCNDNVIINDNINNDIRPKDQVKTGAVSINDDYMINYKEHSKVDYEDIGVKNNNDNKDKNVSIESSETILKNYNKQVSVEEVTVSGNVKNKHLVDIFNVMRDIDNGRNIQNSTLYDPNDSQKLNQYKYVNNKVTAPIYNSNDNIKINNKENIQTKSNVDHAMSENDHTDISNKIAKAVFKNINRNTLVKDSKQTVKKRANSDVIENSKLKTPKKSDKRTKPNTPTVKFKKDVQASNIERDTTNLNLDLSENSVTKSKEIAAKVYSNIMKGTKETTVIETDRNIASNCNINVNNNLNTSIENGKDAVVNDCNNTAILNTQIDSQATIPYTFNGFTQNFTHVSQSQSDNMVINDLFIHGKRNMNSKLEEANDKDLNEKVTEHIDIATEIQDTVAVETLNTAEIQYVIDKNGRTYKISGLSIATDTNLTKDVTNEEASVDKIKDLNVNLDQVEYQTQTTNSKTEKKVIQPIIEQHFTGNKYDETHLNSQLLLPLEPTSTNKIDNENLTKINLKFNDNDDKTDATHTEIVTETNNVNINEIIAPYDDENQYSSDDLPESQTVPFKVIEELNKVKSYLNRRANTDGYNTDSGYRSGDSQRSSYKSALQLTGNGLNQSAHCLFTFLTQCPLVAATHDFTNEISQVLGKLVDRLHEEEKCPSFLEDWLESIESTIKNLYEGASSCENVLQIKDENIQRLFLLNRSQHILKCSIEKLTEILVEIHQNLTKEDTYEIQNVDRMENLCYIFHILEKLLQRYVKWKNNSSQLSSQLSQNEETVLKKSSLTDIWKKKWKPDYKSEAKIESSVETDCLTKIGEILNKIIVDCMEGYSLIAYSALQCFNLMHS